MPSIDTGRPTSGSIDATSSSRTRQPCRVAGVGLSSRLLLRALIDFSMVGMGLSACGRWRAFRPLAHQVQASSSISDKKSKIGLRYSS